MSNQYNKIRENKVKDMISDLCPPWMPVKSPVLDGHDSDPFLDLPFTTQELNFVIRNLRASSSPGFDGIDYKIIVSS